MAVLPLQYHWLLLVFREAADILWSWLPLLIVFYALYQFMIQQITRKVATFKTEGMH